MTMIDQPANSITSVEFQVEDGRVKFRLTGNSGFHDLADTIDLLHRAAELESAASPLLVAVPGICEIIVPAASFFISNAVSAHMVHDAYGDRVTDWGHPRESVSFLVHVEEAAMGSIGIDYVLARQSSMEESTRIITVGDPLSILKGKTLGLPPTCDKWSEPVRQGRFITTDFVPGNNEVRVSVPFDSSPYSNWLDCYSIKVTANKPITLVVQQPRPMTSTLPPPPPPPAYVPTALP